jgi:hypothetical protein
MADFARAVGVSRRTVNRWLDEGCNAQGEHLIRVRATLVLLGLRVREFQDLPDVIGQACILIAQNRIIVDQLKEALGYGSRDALFDVLLGRARMSEEKSGKLNGEVGRILAELGVPEGAVPDEEMTLIGLFVPLVLAMIPVAEYLASDKVSPMARKRMRELAGGSGIFQLANALNRLCGEQARTMIPPTHGGGVSQPGEVDP